MKLKRKKVGDRSYQLVDTKTGKVIATAAQTGEHGRDSYPWEWMMLDDRIFGKLDYDTGRSVESLRDAVDAVESGARQHGVLAPAGKIDAHTVREGQVFKWDRYLFRATQNAYYSGIGIEEVTITANNYKGELTEVKIPFEDQVTLYLPEREARRNLAIAKAKEENVREQFEQIWESGPKIDQREIEATFAQPKESALAAMVRKIDERRSGVRGYVTNQDELVAILSEVSSGVSVGIYYGGEHGGDISVEIKLSLTLGREDL